MERTPLVKRWFARLIGEADTTGSHEAAPDGFLIAFGEQRRSGRLPPRLGRRPRADRPVLHGPADRPGHGRLRAHRSVPERVHAGTSGDVHADARKIASDQPTETRRMTEARRSDCLGGHEGTELSCMPLATGAKSDTRPAPLTSPRVECPDCSLCRRLVILRLSVICVLRRDIVIFFSSLFNAVLRGRKEGIC